MPTNTFGQNDNYHKLNSHFIPSLLRKIYQIERGNNNIIKIWGDGSPRREIIYSEDIADACIFFMNKKTNRHSIKIGTGKDYSIKDSAHFILKIIKPNKKIKIICDKTKPNGTPRKVMDIKLAKKYVWKPAGILNDSILETYKSFLKENNDTKKYKRK